MNLKYFGERKYEHKYDRAEYNYYCKRSTYDIQNIKDTLLGKKLCQDVRKLQL